MRGCDARASVAATSLSSYVARPAPPSSPEPTPGGQALAMSAMRFLPSRSRLLGSPTLSRFSGGRSRRTTAVSISSRMASSGLLHVAMKAAAPSSRSSGPRLGVQSEVGAAIRLGHAARHGNKGELVHQQGRETASDSRRASLASGKVSAYVTSVETRLRLADIQRLAVEGGTQPERRPRVVVAVERIQASFLRYELVRSLCAYSMPAKDSSAAAITASLVIPHPHPTRHPRKRLPAS